MDITYEKSLSEVYKMLECLEYDEFNKISKNFINFIYKNMDMDYYLELVIDDEFITNRMSEKAKELIALIYRDYLVTPEERDKLLQEEFTEEKKVEQELIKKFNTDDLFKKQKNQNNESTDSLNTQISLIPKEPWYKKIFSKVLKLFKLNK